MKIRTGFVSNSSSTSFSIFGIWTNENKEQVEEAADKLGLFTHYDQAGDGIYIGREFSTIKDDETGAQFKRSTQELVSKLPVEKKECHTITEGWYNG